MVSVTTESPLLLGDLAPEGRSQPPGHLVALPLDVCDRVRAAAGHTHPVPSGNGTYYMPDLDPADEQAILERFQAANRLWWKLEVDEWHIGVKRYGVGERHPEHQDLHAGAARRKFAGVVQLSDPDEYDGGALVVRYAHNRAAMPRTRGTLVAFPGWSNHEVEPITRGERWSLCVNAWGAPLR